jgi:protein-arginine kinase activator protein McsA
MHSKVSFKEDIDSLKERMKLAVEKEDFEEAAKIRDKIKSLSK